MAHPDTTFVFDLKKDKVAKIEHFVDFICDQLLINETYSGNILISLSEFFNLVKEIYSKGKLNLTYSTDYQIIKIIIEPVDNQINTIIQSNANIEETELDSIKKSSYLLNALVDKIEFNENDSICLFFDISAVHNNVYAHRQLTLNSYFERTGVKLSKKK
ncbi:MAG TPA: hypothetical protein VIN10_08775 [Bacteroidales bacterium]